MYRVMTEGDGISIYKDDVLLHDIGCLDGDHEIKIVEILAKGICEQVNNQPHFEFIADALWNFLHVMDGQFTIGRIIVLMEEVTYYLAPINHN